jgi:hypothetical protein
MGLTSRNYDHDSSELWDRHPEIMTMTARNYEIDIGLNEHYDGIFCWVIVPGLQAPCLPPIRPLFLRCLPLFLPCCQKQVAF